MRFLKYMFADYESEQWIPWFTCMSEFVSKVIFKLQSHLDDGTLFKRVQFNRTPMGDKIREKRIGQPI